MAINELRDLIFNDEQIESDLENLGFSKKEYKKILESLLQEDRQSYNRILITEEKNILTKSALRYLVKRVHSGAITTIQFEKTMNISILLNRFLDKKITIDITKNIVNYIILKGYKKISVKEILEILLISENKNKLKTN